MAGFARELRRAGKGGNRTLRAKMPMCRCCSANRWLHRDRRQGASGCQATSGLGSAPSNVLDKTVTMREELRQMWLPHIGLS
jgi:hypothetical protein